MCVAHLPLSILLVCVCVLQQQLAAYVSWVNSQLRRRPGLKPVADLRRDLQDGVVLAHLIEIVGQYSHACKHTHAKPAHTLTDCIRRCVYFFCVCG